MRRSLVLALAAVALVACGSQLPKPQLAPQIVTVTEHVVEPCPAINAPPGPDYALPDIVARAKLAVARGLPRPSWREAAAAIRHDAALGVLDSEMVRELFAVLGNRPASRPVMVP